MRPPFAALLLLGILLAGCVDGPGVLVVYLNGSPLSDTEDASAIAALLLTPSALRIHPAGAADADNATGSSWRPGGAERSTQDLLRFTHPDSRLLVANRTAPPGEYDHIALFLEDVRLRNDTGEHPIGTDVVLRVAASFRIVAGETTVVRIMIDVPASLQGDGAARTFVPVVANVTVQQDARSLQRNIPDDGVPHEDNATA